jgi:GAF domain-containing protein
MVGMFDTTELLKEIQEMRDDGFLSDALLRHAVRRIKEEDERFDWVGVYLLNKEEQELWLHNYVGFRTECSRIPVGEGVCGTAVTEGKNLNVPDVSEVENYIVCNPDVASELVVLIRAGDDIFGQINLDSVEPAAFTSEDETAIEAVADKLAEQFVAELR